MKIDSPAFRLLGWTVWVMMGLSLFLRVRMMTLFPDSRAGFVWKPLIYSQGRGLALGVLAFALVGVFVIWGRNLNKKWRVADFRKKTDWIVFVVLGTLLYVVFVWPWWLVATITLIPPLAAWDYYKISSLENSSKGCN